MGAACATGNNAREPLPPSGLEASPNNGEAPRRPNEILSPRNQPTDGPRPDGALSQHMLLELRLRQTRDGASYGPTASVNRWMATVVEANEDDNKEIYDPYVRHSLSMQSVALRNVPSLLPASGAPPPPPPPNAPASAFPPEVADVQQI